MGSNINTGARLPAVMGFAVVVSFAYVLVNLVGICSICGLIRVSDVEVVNDASEETSAVRPQKQTRFNGAKLYGC